MRMKPARVYSLEAKWEGLYKPFLWGGGKIREEGGERE